MSYARFSEGDVYIIGTTRWAEDGDEEIFTCCGCIFRKLGWVEDPDNFFGGYTVPLPDDPGPFDTPSRQAMLDHLREHLAAGHLVPDRAFTGIAEETEWGTP